MSANCVRLRNLFAQKEGHHLRVQDAYDIYSRTYTDGISKDTFGGAIKECYPTVFKRRLKTNNDQLLQFARSQKCTGTNWCVTESQNSIQLWKPDAKFINGLKPCRVLTISNSLHVSASYSGVEIELTRLGLTNRINSTQDFENTLSTITNTPACEGLQGSIYTETQYPALESVCEGSGEPRQVMRSLECSQLVPALPGSKVARCT
ncbi:hypothetical protein Bbelb_349470 [Branchiostoma belcheri]|nr:hypothetical protein Bbelb_349470 [Branchiostoma belcheri]